MRQISRSKACFLQHLRLLMITTVFSWAIALRYKMSKTASYEPGRQASMHVQCAHAEEWIAPLNHIYGHGQLRWLRAGSALIISSRRSWEGDDGLISISQVYFGEEGLGKINAPQIATTLDLSTPIATSAMLASIEQHYLGAFGWTARSREFISCKTPRNPALDHRASDWLKSHANLPAHADGFLRPWSRYP
jgi:hypothetical protein